MSTDESFIKFLRGPGSIITEIKDDEWPAYKRAGKAAGTFSEESVEIGDYNEMPLQTSETRKINAVKRSENKKHISI